MGKGPAEEIGASGSDELKKYLDELDEEMDTFKETKISKGWDKIPDFYSGKNHWGDYRPRHKVSPVLNFLKRAIERKTSLMTDARPYIDVLPFYDQLWPVANAIQDIIASKWFEQSLDMVITDIVFYAELFGSGGTNTLYDSSLRNGLGDITLQFIDPRNLNFDPMITQSQYLDRAEYVRIEQVRATSLLRYEYDNDKIEADAVMAAIQPRRVRGIVGRTVRSLSALTNKDPAIKRSIEREYWIKDRTRGPGKALKYDGGRHIIKAGGVIVIDQANPYWDKKFPTDMLDWHTHPDTAWGDGDILDLTELQMLLNKLVAIIVENGLLTANSIWIGDANALEPDEWENLDNIPGLKVKKKPGSELRREPGTPLPNGVFNLIAYLEGAIEKLLGNTEVVQGSTPGEVKSGVAIEALQTAALAIIRLKSRSVESLLNRVGQKMISRIFQFETDDRSMFSFGSNEEYKKFEFMKSLIRGNKETRKYFKNKQDVWKNFLFKIRPGSSLQLNNWQKSMIAMQMYQMPRPLLDRKAVLETMDWPNRDEIQARLKAEEQEQLEQAIALQGASGGPGSSGGSPARLSNPTGPGANQAVTKGMI
jgi:hypothetical protein